MLEGIISGILSGVIASCCFMYILYGIRPKLKISDNITYEIVNGEPIIQVKIANMTKTMINNVNYALYYVKISDDGINDITDIPARKSILNNISAYDKNDEDAEYAIRISFKGENVPHPLDNDDKLMFIISANHSLSNTSICMKREYFRNHIIDDGIFESKDSMKVIRKNH